MASAGRPTNSKKNKYFTPQSEGAIFLAKSFKQFLESDGTAGIDPFTAEKKEIDEIYEKFSIFQQYSKSQFPQRFRSLADKFKINKFKERKRRDSPSELSFLVFYFIFYLWSLTFVFLIFQPLLKRPAQKK